MYENSNIKVCILLYLFSIFVYIRFLTKYLYNEYLGIIHIDTISQS